ncbi:TPA: hypothetical protein QDB04_000120 [Burkholderia vietnamiensis]|nr:hypothetical protein [Burkholderia vietnamiensis]
MSQTYQYSKPGNVALWKMEYDAAAAEVNNLVLPKSYPDTQFSFSNDGFVIVDPATRRAVQTNFSKNQADQHCRWCNEHEARCGRPEIYAVEPLVRPVFVH